MLETNAPEPANTTGNDVGKKSATDPDKDQLLSTATELCLMYLQCEKLIRKHEKALNPDFNSSS
jgi:hypothetical protein